MGGGTRCWGWVWVCTDWAAWSAWKLNQSLFDQVDLSGLVFSGWDLCQEREMEVEDFMTETQDQRSQSAPEYGVGRG